MELKERIKKVIIEWLGGAYDPDGRMGPGNPDYYNEADVEKLVARVIEVLSD